MKKRIPALCLSLALLGTTALAAPFADVAEDAWYADDVAYVAENGLMEGTSDGFSPDLALDRGTLITVLHRVAGSPAASGGNFADVTEGAPYADAAAWAKETGVITGYGSADTFAAAATLTREQMAVILYRYAQTRGESVADTVDLFSYTDVGEISGWALDAFGWAVAEGVLQGSAGKLMPQVGATRAQGAVVMARLAREQEEEAPAPTSDPDAGIAPAKPAVGAVFYLVDETPVDSLSGYDVHTVVCGGKVATLTFDRDAIADEEFEEGCFYTVTRLRNGRVDKAEKKETDTVGYVSSGVLSYGDGYLTMADECTIYSIAKSTGAVTVIDPKDIGEEDIGTVSTANDYGFVTILYVVDMDA